MIHNAAIKLLGFIIGLCIASSLLEAEQKWTITGEVFDISGRTREKALTDIIGISTGLSFQSKEDLEAFVRGRKQKIENLRAFKKSEITIDYPDAPAKDTPLPIPVVLKVTISDGTPFFPIPYAFYNSNTGFQGGTILTMPNIAGSLQNLMLVGLYTAPPDENDTLQWTNPNFMLLGTWSGIRIKPFQLAFSGMAMKMNQRIESRGDTKIKMYAIALSASMNISYAVTEKISESLSLRAGGSPESRIDENIDPSYLDYGPISSSWEITDSLSYSSFNWIGNFREGYKANISAGYSSITPRFSSMRCDLSAEGDIAGYYILGGRFNPSFRVHSMINSGLPELQSASYIRGIRNTELLANTGIFVNTGVQMRLLRFKAAEVHLTPGLDYAFVTAFSDPSYNSESGFGVGAELILIFDSMKTFPIKLGAAYDLRSKYRDTPAKRLEVDFNFSFAY